MFFNHQKCLINGIIFLSVIYNVFGYNIWGTRSSSWGSPHGAWGGRHGCSCGNGGCHKNYWGRTGWTNGPHGLGGWGSNVSGYGTGCGLGYSYNWLKGNTEDNESLEISAKQKN